jgi:microcin C transport system permease protein
MGAYLLRRLLLVVPTLFGIILINFAVVQFAPGGPVEQMLAEIRGQGDTLGRLTGEGQGETRAPSNGPGEMRGGGEGPVGNYRGAQGLDPTIVRDIERMFGFDKPAHERFFEMMSGYLRFDFGRSLFRDRPVVDLIIEKMPVSISLGLWSTLIIYLVSIPLGIQKAVRDGSRFDIATSGIVLVGYAIPGFLFAILLVVLFAGGSFLQWFPLRGLASSGAEAWPFWQRALDYAWHMALPTLALVIGGFAGLTMLTKNSFMDEIGKQYVVTARAKGARAACSTATSSATPCC